MITRHLRIFKYNLTLILTLLLLLNYSNSECQNSESLFLEAQKLARHKNYSGAFDILWKLVRLEPDNQKYYLELGELFYCSKQYNETIKMCYKALEIDKTSPKAYLLRGKVCLVTKSYGCTILFCNKAINNTDDEDIILQCLKKRGEAKHALENYSEAYNDFLTVLQYDSLDVNTLYSISDIQMKLNKDDEAIRTFKKIIRIEASNFRAYKMLGLILIKMDKNKEAIEFLNKGLKFTPKDAELYCHLGHANYKEKDYNLALSNISKSLNINQDNPVAYKIRALVYLELNQEEKACNDFFKSLQLGYIEKYGYDVLDLYIERCEE